MKKPQNRSDRRKNAHPSTPPDDRQSSVPDPITGGKRDEPDADPAIRDSEMRIHGLEEAARELKEIIARMQSGVLSLASGARSLESGIHGLESGVQNLESRIRVLESPNPKPKAARTPEGTVKRKPLKRKKQ
jgi:exonuclease VII small subunit